MSTSGFVLSIPQTMLDRLETADKKIKQLGNTSEETANRVASSFKKMGDVVKNFYTELNQANKNLSSIKIDKSIIKMAEAISKLNAEKKKGVKTKLIDLNTIKLEENSIESLREKISTLKRLLQTNRLNPIDDNQIANSKALITEIERLQVAYGKLNVVQKERAAYERAINMSENTEAQRARKLERLTQAYDLLSKNTQKYGRELENIKRIQDNIKQKGASLDSKGFSNLAKSAKTLNELKDVADRIKNTMNNIDPKTAEWNKLNAIQKQVNTRIEAINKSMKTLKHNTSSLGGVLSRMMLRMAASFSIYQVVNYVNKLIEVRGEFELQNRALEAILQNKAEANKLWNQTLELAVKSPFQIKELVTYTKQLAAYRIETEKLHDTTKRLADISAGLGVDMSRLVLAYGQVKAANYLRGTELRQFSEAGINILGELSTYFSELEGRFISVGEVFEMVSNRMVAFSDVEEVFRRLTNEGGIFYKMQEKQADTLKGKISNLNDSISIMFNTIGKEQDGIINKSVDVIKDLVENWREAGVILKEVLAIFATYKVATSVFTLGVKNASTSTLWFSRALTGLGSVSLAEASNLSKATAVGNGFNIWTRSAIKLVSSFQLALKGVGIALKKFIPLAVLATIGELYRRLTAADRALKALRENLDGIYSENNSNFKTQVNMYNRLVEKLKDVNEGSAEHKEIISQLNSQYGDYIGFIVTEKTTYDQLAGSIDNVTLALKRRAKTATLEESLSAIYAQTNPSIIDSEKEFKKGLSKVTLFDRFVPSDSDMDKILDIMSKKAIELGRSLNKEEVEDAIKEVTNQGARIWYHSTEFMKAIEKHGKNIILQRNKELEVEQAINDLYKDNSDAAKHRAEIEAIENEKRDKMAEADFKWEKEKIRLLYEEKKIRKEAEWEGVTDDVINQRISKIKTVGKTINDVNDKIITKIGETFDEEFANRIYIDSAEAEKGIGQIAEDTASSYKVQIDLIDQQNKLKAVGTAYDQETIDNATQMATALKYKLYLLGRLDLLEGKGAQRTDLQLMKDRLSALKEANRNYESLRHKYNEDVSTSKTENAFAPLFRELGIGKLTEGMSFDKSGIIEVLNILPKIAGEKGKIAWQEMMSEFTGQVGATEHDNAIKRVFDVIQSQFDRYSLTLKLKDMGLTQELAKQFFGVDYLDLDGLRNYVSGVDTSKMGEDHLKEYKSVLDKVAQMERESYVERVKTYTHYLVEGQREAVKIKMDELHKLKELEESSEFTPDQKEIIKNKIQKETQEKLQSNKWKEFKDTNLYSMMFGDVENLGTQAINDLVVELNKLKASLKDLPANEFKEIVTQFEKLQDEVNKRNPFKALRDSRLALVGIGEEGDLQAQLMASQAKIDEAQKTIDVIDAYESASSKGDFTALSADLIASYNAIAIGASLSQKSVKDVRKEQEGIVEANKKANDEAYQGLDLHTKYRNTLLSARDAWGEIGQQMNKVFDSVDTLMGAFGVGEDDVAGVAMDMARSLSNSVISAIQLGIAIKAAGIEAKSAMGIIGWIALAIETIAGLVASIFKAHDDALVAKINKQKDKVDVLKKSYDKLKEAMDKAWNTDQMMAYYRQMKVNLENTLNAQRSALSAAEAIKNEKKRKEEVEELRESIEVTEKALAELSEDTNRRVTDAFSDIRSSAEEWTNAWYDAFKETGDGLGGLEKNLDKFIEDLAKKQAALSITTFFTDKWGKELKNFIDAKEGDLKFEPEEIKRFAESIKEDLPELHQLLLEFFQSIGGATGSTKSALSGLQKGIQGITEQTAQIIAAYLNSIRFFVSENNQKIDKVMSLISDGSFGNNTILGQLKLIANQTEAINDLLQGLSVGGHSRGGLGLKVFMD